MTTTRNVILSIVVISLLGSVTVAYGLSAVFQFEITVAGNTAGATSNSTNILVTEIAGRTVEIFDLSGVSVGSFSTPGFPRSIEINSTNILVTTSLQTEC